LENRVTYRIERAAVLGAGTMGAAIAAHLANAGIRVLLLDLTPTELTEEERAKGLNLANPAVRDRVVRQGWERCLAARPANLFSERRAELVSLGNFDDDFPRIAEADWILEAVVERLPAKQAVMARIEALRRPGSIVSSNTSGLRIRDIGTGRSAQFQAHFLGTHFFNPPRYLKLLEVIPGEQTKPEILDFMRRFASERLGKGVILCKDTPNFIANRLFSITNAFTLHYALEYGYTIEEVDQLTGELIGNPKTATFRLLDLVGIDIMADVRNHLYPSLAGDPFREVLQSEQVERLATAMIEHGWLGRKSGQGFYRRVATEAGAEFWWLDPDSLEYRAPTRPRFDSVGKHKDVTEVGERLRRLVGEQDRAGSFLWATTAFGLRYAASLVPQVSPDLVSIDSAMKWGFMQELGPFERWDGLGVAESVGRMELEGNAVAPWVMEMLAAGIGSFYQRDGDRTVGCYDPLSRKVEPLVRDPRVIAIRDLKTQGKELQANPSASLLDLGDGVLLLEFHSPANSLDEDILRMADDALQELARDEWQALVIGNQGTHFSAGANLFAMAVAAQQGERDLIEQGTRSLQSLLQRMRANPKPIVAAVFGMALAGGAEVVMGAARVVAAAESYIGLVEAGVGLIPAGSGSKEMLRRVLGPVMTTPNADGLPHLQKVFELIALAKVSESAEQAREMGFLGPADRIVMNSDHLLAEAKREALAMVGAGYRPDPAGKVWAAGRDALANLRQMIWSTRQAGFASDHDVVVASRLAHVLTGGDLSRPGWVPEEHILELEREAFLALTAEPKTQARMWHMLQHRKPLRN
jgi:3-hydroxyacyl-CoA dehydrogenase